MTRINHLYRRAALTLLELLVVIAILGLVTATVTSRLGDTLGPAALQQSISEWKFADGQLRARARHVGKPVSLQLEIGTNRIDCAFDPAPEAPHTIRTLSRGVRVTRYLSATQELSTGRLSIDYDDRGSSQTFAIEFTGHRDERRWLLVAGLTGQITEVKDETTAREAMQQLSPSSFYAG